ncbi:MAG: TrmB family transcriptional regulator [Candidatus Magasanikbacteria bacterium]|nr:TrmB family transcriptional regulator [Candidatus Magasanikbacteria bacterium]
MREALGSLKKYGLTEHEAKVYITLLQLVEATVFNIAENAGLPRTSTYTILEGLKSKGFVAASKKNNILFYTPENPKVFVEALEEKKRIILNALPEMSNLIGSAKVFPVIKFFQGRKGYIKARDEMLEIFKKEKIRQISAISSPADFELFPKYFPAWVSQRRKMGVSARILVRADAKQSKYFSNNRADLREVAYLPPNYAYNGTMNIFGKKIALFSLKEDELNSIIIDSPVITEMFQQFFDLTWLLLSKQKSTYPA